LFPATRGWEWECSLVSPPMSSFPVFPCPLSLRGDIGQ
jgi:hypothetical protein